MKEDHINIFGETNFRSHRVEFGVKTDDRRRHMYVIGKTGMGKSHLLRNLAYNDVQAGAGLAFIDPHGDSADWVLEHIPASRINDVVYVNPTDIDFPVAFNVLEKVDRRYHNLVADGLIGIFKKIWADSWGPRLEYLLRNALLALLDYQDSTLLGVTRMLVDKSYRKKVTKRIKDPVVKAFWVDEFTRYNDRFLVEAIAPIQNKVGQFLANAVIRNIVGQTQSTFDMRDIMDNGKIMLVNLSKGKIGEESSALLGAMLITKLQLAAMSRADVPEEERRDFFMYVDEFQTFATESFADVLSEARKYRLALIMAHQYIEQMSETVSAAVFGNVGTIVSFRIGAADAEVLEKEFEPIFMQNDLVNLPKYNFYVKLMIDGVSGDGFSASTINMKFTPPGTMDKVIRVSRERYSNPREQVEDKIARWSGVFEGKWADPDDKDDDRPGGGGDKRPKKGRDDRSGGKSGSSRPRSRDRQPQSQPRQQSSRSPRSDNQPRQPRKNDGGGKPRSKGQDRKPQSQNQHRREPNRDNRPKSPQPPPAPKPRPDSKDISLNQAMQQSPQKMHRAKRDQPKKRDGQKGAQVQPGEKVNLP